MRLFIFLSLFTLLAKAAPQVAHFIEPFTLEGEELDRHVIFPVFSLQEESMTGPAYLAALSGFILDDAVARGFTHGVSRRYYLQELNHYQAGKWPCTFITKRGEWIPLMHLAYASRWDDSPLPWEARFLGDDGGYLPKEIEPLPMMTERGFVFGNSLDFPELNAAVNQRWLRRLARYRWELGGERTELKFLTGARPSLALFRELLAASKKYGLHRYSFRRPTTPEWERWEWVLDQHHLREKFERALKLPFQSERPQEVREFLRRTIFSRELRPFYRNSWITAHISGWPKGRDQLTAIHEHLRMALNLPFPAYSFLESRSNGRAGIRTDIQDVHAAHYEIVVLTSLEEDPILKQIPASYSGVVLKDENPACRVQVMGASAA